MYIRSIGNATTGNDQVMVRFNERVGELSDDGNEVFRAVCRVGEEDPVKIRVRDIPFDVLSETPHRVCTLGSVEHVNNPF